MNLDFSPEEHAFRDEIRAWIGANLPQDISHKVNHGLRLVKSDFQRWAKILGAKVIIVSQGGIGKPIDEVALNQALFEKEGVEIIGVILNKVIMEKVDYVTEFARRGLKRKVCRPR